MGRVVFVPDRSTASPVARLRAHGYAAELAQRGFETRVFENDIPIRLSPSDPIVLPMLMGSLSLTAQLRTLRSGDILYLVRVQQIPGFPLAALAWARARGVKVVFDFDDGVYLEQPWMTRLLAHNADHVVISGEGHVAYAKKHARAFSIVPTPYEPLPRPGPIPDAEPVIGWMGTPSNLPWLGAVRGAIEEVCAKTGARFRVVTRPVEAARPHVPAGTAVIPWTLETYLHEVSRFHVGIAPLPDTPWNRGKLGLKVIEYQACGVPAVASRIMAKDDVLLEGETGYYAETHDEWRDAMVHILQDGELRARMSRRAMEHAEARFSMRAAGDRLVAVVEALMRH